MAGKQGQPKYGFGWPDGRLGGLGPPGQREARPLPIRFFKIDISDMHHRITYMYINFQQNWVSRSVKKPCAQIYLPKNCKLHKFATILIILFLKINYFRHASP